MAKKQIIFRLTAFSAAAGKYNPNAPLDGNEDNFYVDDDLGDAIPGRFQSDKDVALSDCGCLMVVADGMGGQNAGEVASEIAVATVKDYFAPGRITPQMASSPVERRQYMELVIKEADRRLKADAAANPVHAGMGSTIIMAWIVGSEMTLSWCGDSRAYRFNPAFGLEPLSRDHSYVQELVNQGYIKYEDTFDHPQGNIVTRSLGDPTSAARPESRQFEIYDKDIILLCSDGLSGVLRDRKTRDHNGNLYPGENLQDIIAAHTGSMVECRDALMAAAEKANWYDNVTVLLCQILSGAGKPPKKTYVKEAAVTPVGGQPQNSNAKKTDGAGKESEKKKGTPRWVFLMLGLIIVAAAVVVGLFWFPGVLKSVNPGEGGVVGEEQYEPSKEVVKGQDARRGGDRQENRTAQPQLPKDAKESKNEVKNDLNKDSKESKNDVKNDTKEDVSKNVNSLKETLEKGNRNSETETPDVRIEEKEQPIPPKHENPEKSEKSEKPENEYSI